MGGGGDGKGANLTQGVHGVVAEVPLEVCSALADRPRGGTGEQPGLEEKRPPLTLQRAEAGEEAPLRCAAGDKKKKMAACAYLWPILNNLISHQQKRSRLHPLLVKQISWHSRAGRTNFCRGSACSPSKRSLAGPSRSSDLPSSLALGHRPQAQFQGSPPCADKRIPDVDASFQNISPIYIYF